MARNGGSQAGSNGARQDRVPLAWLVAYSLPGAPIAAMGLPLAVHLPSFYAEDVGLGWALAGSLFMLTRFLDIFLDPIMGVLSDRTRTPWGRRRIWMIASVPIMCIAAWLVFMPEKGVSFEASVGAVFFLFIGWTMLTITHLAWGGELTGNYHERARVTASREAAYLGGMITVLLLPLLVQIYGGDKFMQIAAMGWFVIITLPAGVAIAALVVKEQKNLPPEPHLPLTVGLKAIVGNKALRFVLTADLVAGISGGIVATLFLPMAAVGLGLRAHAYTLLLIYFAMGVVFIPPLVMLARRIGKHQTLILHCLYNVVFLPVFLFIPHGDFNSAAILFAVLGANMSAGPFLFRAIMADVADHDHVETGQARAGVYFALLALTNKAGYSLAVGLSAYTLAYIGLNTKGGNSDLATASMMMLYVVPPTLINAFIAASMLGFPLGEERQRELRRILEERGVLGATIGSRTGHDIEGVDDEEAAEAAEPILKPVLAKDRR
jgi:Na+/melibiose symporter-like transporter